MKIVVRKKVNTWAVGQAEMVVIIVVVNAPTMGTTTMVVKHLSQQRAS